MQIVVNGQVRVLSEPPALPALLAQMRLSGKRLAVELNGAIVPRSAWDTVRLVDGDRIEIVHAIGGG